MWFGLIFGQMTNTSGKEPKSFLYKVERNHNKQVFSSLKKNNCIFITSEIQLKIRGR